MRKIFVLSALVGCGGGGESATPDAAPACTPPAASSTCVEDITVAGMRAAGAAITYTAAPADGPRFRVVLPREGSVAAPALHLATRRKGSSFLLPITDATVSADRVELSVEELGTYQLVTPATAPAERTYTYRAIAGVSMGGFAAAGIGLRSPAKWDLVADLGGDPGPSSHYVLTMISDYLFGGFCPSGGLCAGDQRAVYAGQHELSSSFEKFVYQSGQGVGLTLNRNLYMKATRDLARALGNPALYNPADPYLPPGVPASWLALPDRCASPVVLQGFHDRRFNPDGSLPVITFCDGGDGSRLGLGVFDPELPQENPIEVALAVDRNRNGRRDSGEPVLAQAGEPFADVGLDGKASAQEAGYDAATNPDPAGDDWHPLRNPAGTENNHWRDEGESYEDVGLDGVAGTCQMPAAGCFDHGEGDGRFTLNPGLARWMANDAGLNLTAMDAAQRARIAVYADAGIRDFFNSHVATSTMVGKMATLGMPIAMWNGFPRLGGATSEDRYDFEKVMWGQMAPNVFVRYGNPDATTPQIEAGDGRHVGTPVQLVARLTTVFAWIDSRWPNGDRTRADVTGDLYLDGQRFVSPTTGREIPYAVALPPGYHTSTARYPAVFFMHGYGMSPDDLLPPVALMATYMGEGRLQKMIMVFVDGRCREGDGCEAGTFFMDSPVSPQAQMETHLYQLRAEIERLYRLK
jgi:hypothetical protein